MKSVSGDFGALGNPPPPNNVVDSPQYLQGGFNNYQNNYPNNFRNNNWSDYDSESYWLA